MLLLIKKSHNIIGKLAAIMFGHLEINIFGLICNDLATSQKFVQWKCTYQTISPKICTTCAPLEKLWVFIVIPCFWPFGILKFKQVFWNYLFITQLSTKIPLSAKCLKTQSFISSINCIKKMFYSFRLVMHFLKWECGPFMISS